MEEIDQLIAGASNGNSKSIRALIQKGVDVLPKLFVAIDKFKDKQDVYELSAVIRYMTDANCITPLINRLTIRDRNDIHVDTSIYSCLVNFSSNKLVQEFLVSELNNDNIPLYQKKYLVESLGKSSNHDFSDAIINFIETKILKSIDIENLKFLMNIELEEGESYDKTLILLYATEALIRKEINIWTWIPEYISTFSSGDDEDLKIVLRSKAVDCFNLYVSEKSYLSLVECLTDSYFEIRQEASKALFFIGTPQAVRDLIPLVKDIDYYTANNAMIYIENVLGDNHFTQFEPSELNYQEFKEWCLDRLSNFNETSIYRDGKEFDLSNQVQKLNNKFLRKLAYRDISLYTGNTFDFEDFTPIENQYFLYHSAIEWLKENQLNYDSSFLYRNGKKVNLSFFNNFKP